MIENLTDTQSKINLMYRKKKFFQKDGTPHFYLKIRKNIYIIYSCFKSDKSFGSLVSRRLSS